MFEFYLPSGTLPVGLLMCIRREGVLRTTKCLCMQLAMLGPVCKSDSIQTSAEKLSPCSVSAGPLYPRDGTLFATSALDRTEYR